MNFRHDTLAAAPHGLLADSGPNAAQRLLAMLRASRSRPAARLAALDERALRDLGLHRSDLLAPARDRGGALPRRNLHH